MKHYEYDEHFEPPPSCRLKVRWLESQRARSVVPPSCLIRETGRTGRANTTSGTRTNARG